MPDHSADQPPPASIEQWEAAYEEWFRQYAEAQQGQRSGVYRVTGGKIAVGDTKSRSRWSNWLRGMKSFGFFPRTSIRKFMFCSASTEDSLATDWALVGADLYAAIQECKKK